MDQNISNLNYRQLQTEAKKFGIKANQKIDILRLKIQEAIENQNDFIANIADHKASTPTSDRLESSLISDFEAPSTDDIERIFGGNLRNSQFFDDVLNLPTAKDADSLMHIVETFMDNNVDTTEPVTQLEAPKIEDEPEVDSFCDENSHLSDNSKRKRKLNTTFEMNDNELKESRITEEQRKRATVKEIGHRFASKFSDRVMKTASNLQKKPNITTKRESMKPIPLRTQNFSNNTSRTIVPPKECNPPMFRKPLKITKTTLSTNQNAVEKLPKPNYPIVNGSTTNAIYQKKTVRQSLLPVSKKPNRLTVVGRSSPKLLMKK